MTNKEKPTPGSDEAVAQGCTCPVADNAYGLGLFGIYHGGPDDARLFWVNEDCPLHGKKGGLNG